MGQSCGPKGPDWSSAPALSSGPFRSQDHDSHGFKNMAWSMPIRTYDAQGSGAGRKARFGLSRASTPGGRMNNIGKMMSTAILAGALTAMSPGSLWAQTTDNTPAENAVAERKSHAELVVQNNNWLDAHVYVVQRGMRTSLGLMTALGTRAFELPSWATQSGNDVQILVHLIGGVSYLTPVGQRVPRRRGGAGAPEQPCPEQHGGLSRGLTVDLREGRGDGSLNSPRPPRTSSAISRCTRQRRGTRGHSEARLPTRFSKN